MPAFEYLAPSTVDAALTALAAPGARPLAGGTDLLVQLRAGRVRPAVVVDLKRIAGAIGVRAQASGFVIGVVEAARVIGSVQIQGRATLAGNLCNASPAADSVPALIAARAVCVIAGPAGRREMPVESIATAPGRTSLAPGEFVLEICLPPRPVHAADAYLRLIPRTEMDIAVVGAAVNLWLDAAGVITQAHVALGAVAPTALLVPAAGAALVGGRLDAGALARLDAAARAACRPISDKRGTAAYRTRIAGVLARRAAAIAYERAAQRR